LFWDAEMHPKGTSYFVAAIQDDDDIIMSSLFFLSLQEFLTLFFSSEFFFPLPTIWVEKDQNNLITRWDSQYFFLFLAISFIGYDAKSIVYRSQQ